MTKDGGLPEVGSGRSARPNKRPSLRFAYLMVARELYIDFLSRYCPRNKLQIFPQAIRDRLSDVRRVIDDPSMPTIIEASPSLAAWLLCNCNQHDPLHLIAITHTTKSRLSLYGTQSPDDGAFNLFLHPGEQVAATQLAEMYFQLRKKPYDPYSKFASQDLGDYTAVKEAIERLCRFRQSHGKFPTDVVAVLGGSRDTEFRESHAIRDLGLAYKGDLARHVYAIIKHRIEKKEAPFHQTDDLQFERDSDDIPSGLLLATRSTLRGWGPSVCRFLDVWDRYVQWVRVPISSRALQIRSNFDRHGFEPCDSTKTVVCIERAMTFTRLVQTVLPIRLERSQVLAAGGYLPRSGHGKFVLDEDDDTQETSLKGLIPMFKQDMLAVMSRTNPKNKADGTRNNGEKTAFFRALEVADKALKQLDSIPSWRNYYTLCKANLVLHVESKEFEGSLSGSPNNRVSKESLKPLLLKVCEEFGTGDMKNWTQRDLQRMAGCNISVARRLYEMINGRNEPGRPKRRSD